MLDEVRDSAAGAFAAGLLDDQGHADRLVVHEQAVLALAVCAEALAVIADEDDRRLVRRVAASSGSETRRPTDLVDVRDFAIVRIVVSESVRRRVGRTRLVEMKKQERARRARFTEPSFGAFLGLCAIATDDRPAVCLALSVELIVEER